MCGSLNCHLFWTVGAWSRSEGRGSASVCFQKPVQWLFTFQAINVITIVLRSNWGSSALSSYGPTGTVLVGTYFFDGSLIAVLALCTQTEATNCLGK